MTHTPNQQSEEFVRIAWKYADKMNRQTREEYLEKLGLRFDLKETLSQPLPPDLFILPNL